jgi:CRP-like cAMP-binding protein
MKPNMKQKLKACIRNQVSISIGILEEIVQPFEALNLESGELFAEPGRICHNLGFIGKGALRMFNIADGQEITIWIGSEDRFITDLGSFIHQHPARWYIEAVNQSELLVISREKHFSLLEQHPEWLDFDNRLLTSAYMIMEQRIYSHLYMSAEERYLQLLNTEPGIFNKVPLKYIASMLGMTPETLSRLRAKKAFQL